MSRIRQVHLATLLIFVYAAYLFSYFLGEGLPIFFDAHSHLTRNWFSAEAFARGQFPDWSFSWYGGYRFGEYYGSLYYC